MLIKNKNSLTIIIHFDNITKNNIWPKYFYQKFGQRTEKKTSWGAFSKLTDKEKIYLKTNLFSNLFIYLSFILYKYWRNKDLHVSKSFYPAELNDSAITQLNDRNQPIQHFFVVNKLFPILVFWVIIIYLLSFVKTRTQSMTNIRRMTKKWKTLLLITRLQISLLTNKWCSLFLGQHFSCRCHL